MKSQHVACFNSVAAAIETTIKDNLLDTQTYGSECTNSGLAGGINDIPASAFMGQNIIIIVDDGVNNKAYCQQRVILLVIITVLCLIILVNYGNIHMVQ